MDEKEETTVSLSSIPEKMMEQILLEGMVTHMEREVIQDSFTESTSDLKVRDGPFLLGAKAETATVWRRFQGNPTAAFQHLKWACTKGGRDFLAGAAAIGQGGMVLKQKRAALDWTKEEISYTERYGMPHPGISEAGWGSEKPGSVEDVLAHCREI